jgi:tetratricopeptide (TPR) repeat protein
MAAPYVCDLPGRDRDVAWLVAQYRTVVAEGHGQLVFVAGDEGSGRSELLRALPAAMAHGEPRPAALAGAFDAGSYVAWDSEPATARVLSVMKRVIAVGEPVASLTEGVLPYGGLLRQVLSKSKAALELAERLNLERGRSDVTMLMPRVLRALCKDGPVVCVVDDVDHAVSGWWVDLILLFAREVARDLPLLLVLGMTGPPQLGPHEDDEPDGLFAARDLEEAGLAQWYSLAPIGIDDVRRWTGGASGDVARALLEVTGGRAQWTAELWRDWQHRGAVEQLDDGRWRFVRGREGALDEVKDRFGERLVRLLGTSDLHAAARTRRLLACAALEGRRFTADAVARALERDRDEVIDELDDKLTLGDRRPEGLVIEEGSLNVHDEIGERFLWLYRFGAELDWLALRHHGLTDAERQSLSRKLAHAMRVLYGGEAHRVARTLARLYRAGGDADRSARFQRMSDLGVSRDVILWRARRVLAVPDPQTRAERRRASQILIAAADQLFHSGPFAQGLEFAQEAHRLAQLRGDEAHALYLIGQHEMALGTYAHAHTHLHAALKLYGALGHRRGEAATRHALALIDHRQGNFDAARREFGAVLELLRALGDRHGEAATRHALANIDHRQGNFDAARREFAAAHELLRALGDRHGEATTRHALALIDLEQGNFDAARREFGAVLELLRALGDRHGEATARHALANIDREQGNFDAARREFAAVLELRRALGDRHGEATTRHALALIDLQEGNFDAARREFAAVLELRRALGDHRGEAEAREALLRIDDATTERQGISGEPHSNT